MKNIFKAIALSIVLGGTSIAVAQETVTIAVERGPSDYGKEKFKPEKGMVDVNSLQGEFTIKVGQKIYLSESVHGSVGETASVDASGYCLKLVDTHFSYDDHANSHLSGGDAGVKTFIYEAVKVGESEIEVKEMFRGDERNTNTIKITVVN